MLFALIGFYRKGAEIHFPEIAPDVNEYLGQLLSSPRLAAVLRGDNGERIGNLMIVEAASFEEANTWLRGSPALQAGLYDRSEIAELQIEVGDVAPP
jgi:uncharacterized protein YciI